MFTNMSTRVLRSSFLRGSTGSYSIEISRLFDQTDSLLAAVQDVGQAVRVILVRTTVEQDDLDNLQSKILVLQSERAALASRAQRLALRGNLGKADIRTAAWYTMLLRGCKEVARLAKRLSERADYQSKRSQWTFRARLPR